MAFFNLMAKLGLDNSEFKTGMKQAESSAVAFGKNLKTYIAGALTTAAVGAALKRTLDYADSVQNLADAYDMTTDQVQVFTEAAKRNGIEVGALIQATVKLNEARQKATSGDEASIKAFERFGITIDDLNNASLDTISIWGKVSEASTNSARSFEDQQAMVDLLGSKSARLSEAIRSIQSMGPINLVSEDELRRIDEMGDKLGELESELERYFAGKVGGALKHYENLQGLGGGGWKAFAGVNAIVQTGADFLKDVFGNDTQTGPALAYTPRQAQLDLEAAIAGRGERVSFGLKDSKSKSETMKAAKIEKQTSDWLANPSELARQGGLYFGANYNQNVLETLKAQVEQMKSLNRVSQQQLKALQD